MDQNDSNSTLESLDLFKLLRLDHLSDEEKTDYTNKLLDVAFTSMLTDDLPLYLTPEEIAEFTDLSQKPEQQNQAVQFLQAKVPQLDQILKDKLLTLKQSLVKANIEERLDINKTEYDELRSQPESPEVSADLVRNQKDRTNLEQSLKAATEQNWDQVNQLIAV